MISIQHYRERGSNPARASVLRPRATWHAPASVRARGRAPILGMAALGSGAPSRLHIIFYSIIFYSILFYSIIV